MYSRTQNENGTYNSRCLDCLLTIASYVETEKELIAREAHHLCPEKVLAQSTDRERSAAAQQPKHSEDSTGGEGGVGSESSTGSDRIA